MRTREGNGERGRRRREEREWEEARGKGKDVYETEKNVLICLLTCFEASHLFTSPDSCLNDDDEAMNNLLDNISSPHPPVY